MNIDEVREITKRMRGWLAPAEGELLYNLAKQCTGEGVIVEIGSWVGKSTVHLAAGSQEGSQVPVFAVDPHTGCTVHLEQGEMDTLARLKTNLERAGVQDLVTPIVKTSEDAAKTFDQPIELLFIDGVHFYEYVTLDCELWLPKLIAGGTVALHDTATDSGPKRAVAEAILSSRQYSGARNVSSTTYATKAEGNSFADRLRSRSVQLLINAKYIGNVILRPRNWLIRYRRRKRLLASSHSD
jgi:predicted O-methyltransferase YrrM